MKMLIVVSSAVIAALVVAIAFLAIGTNQPPNVKNEVFVKNPAAQHVPPQPIPPNQVPQAPIQPIPPEMIPPPLLRPKILSQFSSVSWVERYNPADFTGKREGLSRNLFLSIDKGSTKIVTLELTALPDAGKPVAFQLDILRKDSNPKLPEVDIPGVEVAFTPRTFKLNPGQKTSFKIIVHARDDAPDAAYAFQWQITTNNSGTQYGGYFELVVGNPTLRPPPQPILPIVDKWFTCGKGLYNGEVFGHGICREEPIKLSPTVTRKFNMSTIELREGREFYGLYDNIFYLPVEAGQRVRFRINATAPVNLQIIFTDDSKKTYSQITSLDQELSVGKQGILRLTFYAHQPKPLATVMFEFQRLQ